MEQPQVGVSKNDSMLVRSFDTLLVHHASARSSKVANAALARSVHIIREGKECITRACNSIELLGVRGALFGSKRRRDALEEALPLRLLTPLKDLTTDEEINSVSFLSTLDSLLERKVENSRVVSEPPEVGFGTCKSRAVNTRLLACADSDNGTAVSVCDTVGLCVLERKSCNDEICESLVGKLRSAQLGGYENKISRSCSPPYFS